MIDRSLYTRLSVLALTTFVIVPGHSSATAAPITYRFEATVGRLPPFNDDVGLPFTLEEGSVIDGQFTFDADVPAEPSPSTARTYIQPFSFELSFAGYSFGAELYEARVNNDSLIIDGPNAGPADFITFSCSASSLDVECNSGPVQLPGAPPLTLGMTTILAGDISLLSESRLPSDAEIWNAFMIMRWLRFSFASGGGRGALFDTALSSFTLVPEPSSLGFSMLGGLWLFAKRTSLHIGSR